MFINEVSFLREIITKTIRFFFEPIEKYAVLPKAVRILLGLIWGASILLFGMTMSVIVGNTSTMISTICMLLICVLASIKSRLWEEIGVIGYITALFTAYKCQGFVWQICIEKWGGENWICFTAFGATLFALACFVCLTESIIYVKLFKGKPFNYDDYIRLFVNLFAILFIVYIFIPTESFFNNLDDFDFKYVYLIRYYAPRVLIISFLISIIISYLKSKIADTVISVLLGISVSIYLQYMFMNRLLRILDGYSVDWKVHNGEVVINSLVWLIVLVLPFGIARFNRDIWKKVSLAIPIMLLFLHVLSFITILVSGLPKEKQGSWAYLSYEEQLKVSEKGNIIVFVIDAADNDYMAELMENSDNSLDSFNDFTIFTNTCAVYDSTMQSIMTMMAGAEFDNTVSADEWYHKAWTNTKTEEFYSRIHEAGYKVNYYNFLVGNATEAIGKIDNLIPVNEQSIIGFNYDKLSKAMSNLVLYRISPYLIKKRMDTTGIDFSGVIETANFNMGAYDNELFNNRLNTIRLSLSDEDRPYLIYQHISGVHEPCEDVIETTKECLKIVGEYLNQMKELGVYDNSTIIVTADHGRHDGHYLNELFASTPIFFIKEANRRRDMYEVCDAPIYHEDIIPTILANANMYDEMNETDVETFGTSIYMHHEGEKRERIWYDIVRDDEMEDSKVCRYSTFSIGLNAYYEYRYTGDYNDFKRIVNDRIIWRKYPMYEFWG